jgi:hypothetical protein
MKSISFKFRATVSSILTHALLLLLLVLISTFFWGKHWQAVIRSESQGASVLCALHILRVTTDGVEITYGGPLSLTEADMDGY